jgi:hypothetical protein
MQRGKLYSSQTNLETIFKQPMKATTTSAKPNAILRSARVGYGSIQKPKGKKPKKK